MAVKTELNGDQKLDRRMLRFALVLVACFVAFAIAYFMLRRSEILAPFLAFNARAASAVLSFFGLSVQSEGALISSGGHSFQVITECTSLVPTAILVSAVIAWQSSAKQKMVGILVGALFLFLLNMVRIMSLLYVGTAFPEYLDIAHFIIWQALLILATVGVWILWVSKVVRSPGDMRQHQTDASG